jgi:hypothetical protein
MPAPYDYWSSSGYLRARPDWANGPGGGTPILEAHLDRWDQAIFDLKTKVRDVRDFGAVSGAADNSGPFQDAYDAACADATAYVSGQVFVPDGHWKCVSDLDFNAAKNVLVTGPPASKGPNDVDGYGAVIETASAGMTLINAIQPTLFQGGGLKLANVTLQDGHTPYSSKGLCKANVNRWQLRNVTFKYFDVGLEIDALLYGAPTILAPTNLASANLAGGALQSGSTYKYAVTAYTAAGGETNASNLDTHVPSGGNLSVRLTWTAPSGTFVGYRIYRRQQATGSPGPSGAAHWTTWEYLGTVAAGTTQYDDVGPGYMGQETAPYTNNRNTNALYPGAPPSYNQTGTITGTDNAWSYMEDLNFYDCCTGIDANSMLSTSMVGGLSVSGVGQMAIRIRHLAQGFRARDFYVVGAQAYGVYMEGFRSRFSGLMTEDCSPGFMVWHSDAPLPSIGQASAGGSDNHLISSSIISGYGSRPAGVIIGRSAGKTAYNNEITAVSIDGFTGGTPAGSGLSDDGTNTQLDTVWTTKKGWSGSTLAFFGGPQQTRAAAMTAPNAGAINSGDGTTDAVIGNLRTRVNELEAIVKRYSLLP